MRRVVGYTMSKREVSPLPRPTPRLEVVRYTFAPNSDAITDQHGAYCGSTASLNPNGSGREREVYRQWREWLAS